MEERINRELTTIKNIVNNRFNVDIGSVNRNRLHVKARYFFYKICRESDNYTYRDICKAVNKKQHSTVIHALTKWNDKINDADLKQYELCLLDIETHFKKPGFRKTLSEMSKDDLIQEYMMIASERDKYRRFHDLVKECDNNKNKTRKSVDLMLDTMNENLLNEALIKLKAMVKVNESMNKTHKPCRAY